MKTKSIILLVLSTLSTQLSTTFAQGTAFTYQGQLSENGAAANGSYDLRLILYNAEFGGSQAGPTLTNENVSVTNGLFTTAIDFGAGVFAGTAYWLEIAVRLSDSTGSFTLLEPRQPIRAVPYALYASQAGSASTANAAPWSGLTGVPAGFADGVDNDTTYSAGMGLDLTGTQFSVRFGGSGASGAAARADHNHDTAYALLAHTHSAADLVSGTLANGRLAGTYSSALTFNNSANQFAGDGSELTGLNAFNLVSGTIADARLSSNVALLNANQTFNGSNIFAGVLCATNIGNKVTGSFDGRFSGQFEGNGNSVSNLNAVNLVGIVPDAQLSSNVARLNANQTFTGTIRFNPAAGAPFAVGNSTKVNNLNADLLDGLDFNAFAPSNHNHDSSYWKLTGNSSTAPGAQFLGTTDNQALELKVNGARALRIEPGGSPNLLGGFNGNAADAGVVGATIGGGGRSGSLNTVSGDYGVVAGGLANEAGAIQSTIGGGRNNHIETDAFNGAISGGINNTIRMGSSASTIGGGSSHTIESNAINATISGGLGSRITTNHSAIANLASTISGGSQNVIFNSSGYTTIAGGHANSARGLGTTISGGTNNFAGYFFDTIIGFGTYPSFATIAGGRNNAAIDQYTTIGGGEQNRVESRGSTISGGQNNRITNATDAVITGGDLNSIEGGTGSAIGGGSENIIHARWATIGGGRINTILDSPFGDFGDYVTIGGGSGNTANRDGATIAGGFNNSAQSIYATVGGGYTNAAVGHAGTVGGGEANTVSGSYGAVAGGYGNLAAGDYGFAAGRRAKANHDGCFVWGDSTDAQVASTTNNQFIVRASGGAWFGTSSSPSLPVGRFINTSTGGYLSSGGTWTDFSDRDAKEHFIPVEPRQILNRVVHLPIATWNYKAENDSVKHIGPVAQDFHAAFNVGNDERHIAALDGNGVALAAIQGLNQKLEDKLKEREQEIRSLQQRLEALEKIFLQAK